jgi:hypothetical protein
VLTRGIGTRYIIRVHVKRASFSKQADDSVLVRLMTADGPCDLLVVHSDLTVSFFVACPRVPVVEVISILVRAQEVQLLGRTS